MIFGHGHNKNDSWGLFNRQIFQKNTHSEVNMNIQEQILKLANEEIGTKETATNQTKYNVWFYGKQTTAQWCCIFISWLFGQINRQDLFPKNSACRNFEKWADKNGLKTVSISEAQPADIVTFDFDNVGEAHHIGIINRVIDNKTIETIEGNTSNMVMKKKRTSYRKIYRPNYTANASVFETVKRGSKNTTVMVLQYLLNSIGFNLEVDGDFGIITETAVEIFQKDEFITVDGIVGKITWKHLLSEVAEKCSR